MKRLFLLSVITMLSCGKSTIYVDRPEVPEVKNALQMHTWDLDSMITVQNGKVVSRDSLIYPDYKYYTFTSREYSYWSSSKGIKSTHTGYYEYLPDQVSFWDLNQSSQAGVINEITVLNDVNLVYYNSDQKTGEPAKTVFYYFHAD